MNLQPVPSRPGGLPVVLFVLTVGVAAGVLIGRALPAAPAAAAIPSASVAAATASSNDQGSLIVRASVAPDLVEAYQAARVTSAELAPVVCTTGTGLACQPAVPEVVDIESASGAPIDIPTPDELWTRLIPVHLDGAGAAVDTIVAVGHSVDSSFFFSSVDEAGWLYSFASAADRGFPGSAVFADLGHLGPGQYVVLIRSNSLFGVSPEWTAVGLEVAG